MAEILLFHHVLGLTTGVQAFANALAVAGHDVTTPDLFDGATFDSIEAGVAHAAAIGFDTIAELGARHADRCGDALVVGGFSLGVLPAQKIAQQRAGVVGAMLYHGAVPLSFFGDGDDPDWPAAVPVEIHIGADDPFAAEDLAAAEEIAERAEQGTLHLYATDGHLVTDVSSSDYDADVARQILERSLAFLATVG